MRGGGGGGDGQMKGVLSSIGESKWLDKIGGMKMRNGWEIVVGGRDKGDGVVLGSRVNK